jgi:tripeptidyl-peptidase-2
VKAAQDLYPKGLKDRITKERKEKLWDPAHRAAAAKVMKQCNEYDALYPEANQVRELGIICEQFYVLFIKL